MINEQFISLFNKYWLDNQRQFYIAFGLLILVVWYAVNSAQDVISQHPETHAGREIVFSQYVWVIIYKGYFLTIFSLASFVLGLGGPIEERLSGTALFTLSLPVYRRTLIRAKVLASSTQIVVLATGSVVYIPLISMLFGFTYPFQHALLFSLLMIIGGFFFMMLGLYLSFTISRQMVVIPVGVTIMSLMFFIMKTPLLKHLNIFNFMTGAGYLSDTTFLFNQTINIGGIFVILGGLFMATRLLERMFKKVDV
ncbi:MAG: hypothetical protein JWQ28_670 [Pedobacter sp.]|nr:hypothetical protein [Pedobacter sp.]